MNVHNLTLDSSYVGHYVYLDDAWQRILYVHEDGQSFEIGANAAQSGGLITMIAVMNRITIAGDNLNLSSIELDYTPMLR